MSVNMPPAVPHVKAGKLRALAVTTRTRSSLMPEVPTIAESGLAGYETVASVPISRALGTNDKRCGSRGGFDII